MPNEPDPIAALRERDVNSVLAPLPRALAHAVRDALLLAWGKGYDAGKRAT